MGNYQVRFLEDGVESNPTLLFDISPILANMTLDSIEKLLMAKYPKRGKNTKKVNFIRYADDCAPRKRIRVTECRIV